MEKETSADITTDPAALQKRRREQWLIVIVGIVFLALTIVLFKLFNLTEELPINHSIFFFGLVNFNIILFLILMFFIFRNIVKNFAEREGGPIGSSLKSKLIAAFVGFSVVPTALMFIVSVFYINNSFDRWFNERISNVLKSSIEVTNNYYFTAKKKNYHFAHQVALGMQSFDFNRADRIPTYLEHQRQRYGLDAVEYYSDLFNERVVVVNKSDGVPSVPITSLEFREKGVKDKSESSMIHHYAEGDLIRVIVPVEGAMGGAIVVSSYIPLSLVSKMDDITTTLENFRDSDPLAYPIKSIYMIILVLMTLVILLCATWFGFYLARQLSVPLEKLVQATQKVVKGSYEQVNLSSGSPEINRLINNFNQMTDYLEKSETEIQSINTSLRRTLSRLDQHNRYMEVVMSQVTTGVVSVDENEVITMVNQYASRLLKVTSKSVVGRRVREVLKPDYYSVIMEMITTIKKHDVETLHREVQIMIEQRPVILSLAISQLKDEQGKDIGQVLVFDDMSSLLAAQRATAWTEVARRIAHEIKNPLTPISLAAQRLQKKFGDQNSDPAFKDCTQMIIDQVEGLKRLVNEFSQFARMPKSKLTLTNLNQIALEGIELFKQAEQNINIHFNPDPHLPEFLLDADQIQRALTNLLDNAWTSVAAVPDGSIDIETKYDQLAKVARLIVSDNGMGIPPHMKDRIFEPYMTTKKNGTGLGLAIVKRTVEDHNGYVRHFDNQPHGTRFVIELPMNMSNTSEQVVRVDINNLNKGPTL
jgi:two-component system nitrogen regulation sensor histidine kinase NtrY